MRNWIFSLCILLVFMARQSGAAPFPNDTPMTFTYSETVRDEVYADPDSFDPQNPDYFTRERSTVVINASAPITGFDVATVDELTPYELTVQDFTRFGNFSDVDGTLGANSFVIPIMGIDENGDDHTAGSFRMTWSSTRVSFVVTVTDADLYSVDSVSGPGLSSVAANDPDFYPGINNPAISDETILGTIGFGPFSSTRLVYTTGVATAVDDPSGHYLDGPVSRVDLVGSIDSVPPTLIVSHPVSNAVLTTNDVGPNGEYTISGTVSDTRRVDGVTFPSNVSLVEVKLGMVAAPGSYVPAQLNMDGTWLLANAIIEAGKTFLSVRATDSDGNITTVVRNFTFTKKGNLSVTCAADGYPPSADGNIAGTVTGSFFKFAPGKKLTMVVGNVAPPQDAQSGVESGQDFTVEAKPGPGSVFNGWIGTIKGVTVLNAVTAKLEFETKPDLVLTAHFTPDPFGSMITGTYNGLLSGANAARRGLIQLKLGKLGAFSGRAKIGAVTLIFKGKVLGSGTWFGTVKKGAVFYTVNLNFLVAATGDRLVTGAITGGGLNSLLTADLADWHKPKLGDPGKLADAYVGTYNVLLPAAAGNTDVNFPAGIGFGRVKITKSGKVSFIGKLGDGTPVGCGATLAKRNTGAVLFPLYLGLDRKLGSVAGNVNYDSALANSDLAGTLEWAEPTSKAVDPHSFAGQIALHGSKYVPPAAGERVILQGTLGGGQIALTAPNYSKPVLPLTAPLSFTSAATLDTAQSLGPVGAFEMVQLKFNPKTGFFTGTYRDFILNEGNPAVTRTIKFQGAASRKANGGAGEAGGVFIRGNRAGAIHFGP